jgi:preprotein translocase subunit SecE
VATTEVVTTRSNPLQRVATFYQEVVAEMKKVTWPDQTQVRQLSIGVIVLSLFIGAVIALMDLIFQAIFVRGLPNLLGG